MIDPDLRFEGFDARSWKNLLSLFAPGLTARTDAVAADSDAPEGGPPGAGARTEGSLLVVVDEDDHPLAAMHTLQGRMQLPSPIPAAEHLCLTHGARRCVVLREGTLEELSERFALRLAPDDDYLEQCIALLRTLREMVDAGHVRVWPRRYANVPIPSADTVLRGLDLVLPDGRVALLALWDGPRLWAAVALRRQGGRIDWVVGPDPLARWAPIGGGPQRCAEDLARAVGDAMAPVHVGIFADVSAVRPLLREGAPGGWATAVAAGEVILQPMPPYVAMALGADVLRGLAQSSAKLFGDRVGSALTPMAQGLRERLGRARSLTATLGFDPLELLSRYLRSR
jgi:hypothetical protein